MSHLYRFKTNGKIERFSRLSAEKNYDKTLFNGVTITNLDYYRHSFANMNGLGSINLMNFDLDTFQQIQGSTSKINFTP